MIDYLVQERLWLMEPEAYLRLAALPRLASMPQLSAQGDIECRYEQQGPLATVPIRGKMLRERARRCILLADSPRLRLGVHRDGKGCKSPSKARG